MPREIYYQDVGNPVQFDRLPSTQPTITLARFPLAPRAALAQILVTFGWAYAAVVAAVLLAAVNFPGWTGFYWPLPVACGIALGWKVINGWHRWRSISAWIAAYAALAVLVFLPTSLGQQLVVTAFVVGLFGWQFGRHWISVCTVSPIERGLATQLQTAWQVPLLFSATVPVVAVVLWLWSGSEWLPRLFLAALCGILLLLPRPASSVGKLQVIFESLASWCTYDLSDAARPGLLQTPAGGCLARLTLTCATAGLVGATWSRGLKVTKPPEGNSPATQQADADPQITPAARSTSASWEADLAWFAAENALKLVTAIAVPILLILPVLLDASQWRQPNISASNWQALIHQLQHSPDPHENRSYYMGRVAADGTPLIVPRPVFHEHAHFPGDAGSGKTSLGLAPWIEQTVLFGDCSLVLVDLKADTLELLATLLAARKQLHERTGSLLPLKYLSNQSQLSTYVFNPLTQPYWADFDPYIKTDILCGAMGLLYGTDYGRGWYTAANAAVLHYTIKRFPHVRTLRELAEHVNETVLTAKKQELHPELRNAGVHVQAVLDRLGSFDALNVAEHTGHDPQIVREAIDLSDLFRRPQILFAHLSSSLSPGSSPEIARLLVYSLLCAASQTERKCQVFLVIDEFQRMVAHNVEYMLQLARSMGVGVILANQSLQDLGDLIPAVEANCRYRQWFSVSSLDDRQRLIEPSGETVDRLTAKTTTPTGLFSSTESTTVSEQILKRLSHNDVSLASDHPLQSIVRISRGSGYAQYGGLPFVVESDYHISPKEYDDRKRMCWPDPIPGTFIPKHHRPLPPPAPPKPPSGPVIVIETIGALFSVPPYVPSEGDGHDRKSTKRRRKS